MSSSAPDDPALGVKVVGIFIVFLTTLIGTIPPFVLRTAQLEMTERRQRLFSWMNCLGGGIFLGFGFLHILPEAVQDFKADTRGFPLIYFLSLCGFMLILLVEKFFTWLSERASSNTKFEKLEDQEEGSAVELHDLEPEQLDETETNEEVEHQATDGESNDGHANIAINDSDNRVRPRKHHHHHSHGDHGASPSHGHAHSHGLPLDIASASPLLPYILTVGLSFHSFFEGMALALTRRFITAIVILTGLAVHKSAETFAIGIKLVNTSISSRKWVWLMLTYSAITPCGIITGILVENSVSASSLETVSSILQGFTVGTFLYVGVLGTIVEEFSSHRGIIPKALLFFFGLIVMGLLSMIDSVS